MEHTPTGLSHKTSIHLSCRATPGTALILNPSRGIWGVAFWDPRFKAGGLPKPCTLNPGGFEVLGLGV